MSLSFATTAVSAEEFCLRRADAVRNGNPAWLWPEVSVAGRAVAMASITKVISEVLAGKKARLTTVDPKALSLAAYTSGMGPLLGWWVEQGLLTGTAETRKLLAMHLEQSRHRSVIMAKRSRDIVSKLAIAGVPVIVLKGGYTALTYFPDPATRPASDLDLLVPARRYHDAEATLTEAGLSLSARNERESTWVEPNAGMLPRYLWLVGPNDPWSVDLHRSLDFLAGPGSKVVEFDSVDPFANRQSWPLDDSAGALSQPLLLLHLAVHASGGLQSLTLLRMVEIIHVVRRDFLSRGPRWREFLEVGAEIGGLGAAYPALSMSEQLAPNTIPTGVLAISRELAPRRVRSVVEKLDPTNVQRIERASISEHFLWVQGISGWRRQIWADLTAEGASAKPTYLSRAYRLLRGRITR